MMSSRNTWKWSSSNKKNDGDNVYGQRRRKKKQDKMCKIVSLGKGHIGIHGTFPETLSLFPNKKWKKRIFWKSIFWEFVFLSHKSKELRAGCFQIQLDFLICSQFWTWVLLGSQATRSFLNTEAEGIVRVCKSIQLGGLAMGLPHISLPSPALP